MHDLREWFFFHVPKQKAVRSPNRTACDLKRSN